MSMEMDRLTDRMGTETIPPVKQSISIDTMINFDRDGDGDGTCKQAFTQCKPRLGEFSLPARFLVATRQ